MRILEVKVKVERGGLVGGLFNAAFGNPARAEDFNETQVNQMAIENADKILREMKKNGEIEPTATFKTKDALLTDGRLKFIMEIS